MTLTFVCTVAFGQSDNTHQNIPDKNAMKPTKDKSLFKNYQGTEVLDNDGKPLNRKKKLFPFNQKTPAVPGNPKPIKISENDCPVVVVS
ncbi:hypothetical protein JYU20_00060 [Bacteroidales bacterium AH-315-I05]|nr:hypothetical protein [Bacteroidales bacterium AH-315-I05]